MPGTSSRSPLRRLSRSLLLIVASLTLAIGLIACGGDDEEEADPTATAAGTTAAGTGTRTAAATSTTPAASATTTASSGGGGGESTEEGDAVAHAAMISEADLPGTGWTVLSTDEFGGSLLDVGDDSLGDTPACTAYYGRVESAAVAAEEARIGRAAKSFSKTADLLGTSVDIEVAVYDDADAAGDLIAEAKGAFESSEFEDCFREVISESGGEIPEEVEFEITTSDARVEAPHDGIAQAFDVKLNAAGMSFGLHAELYAWADREATAFVSVFGDPEELTIELVEAAVEKTEQKLSDAQ